MFSLLLFAIVANTAAQEWPRVPAKVKGECGSPAASCKENCTAKICPLPYYCQTNTDQTGDDCIVGYSCAGTCQLLFPGNTTTPAQCPSKVEVGKGPVALKDSICGVGKPACPRNTFCRFNHPHPINTTTASSASTLPETGVCVSYVQCGGMRPRMQECVPGMGPQIVCREEDRCIDVPLRPEEDANSSCGMACDAPGICAPTDVPCGKDGKCPAPLTCVEMDESNPRKQRAGWPEKGSGFCI